MTEPRRDRWHAKRDGEGGERSPVGGELQGKIKLPYEKEPWGDFCLLKICAAGFAASVIPRLLHVRQKSCKNPQKRFDKTREMYYNLEVFPKNRS